MSRSYPLLNINLSALAHNYRVLVAQASGAQVAAVVKASAYGLGVGPVSASLFQAGCRAFFVASTEEGVALRNWVPSAQIYVLQGVEAGDEAACLGADLIPVLISRPMAERFLARRLPQQPYAVKVNTGMNRLGLEPDELLDLLPQLPAPGPQLLISHLACADTPEHPLNLQQLQCFNALVAQLRSRFPGVLASLANSAGVFLGSAYHADLVRPGAALYGINPCALRPNPLRPVVSLALQVIQTREVAPGAAVGYGASHCASGPGHWVVVSGGYADGLLRALSNRGFAHFNGQRLPLVGRVSMDSAVFDASALAPALRPREGDRLEVFGEHLSVDDQAQAANTIGYELFTRLGERCQRHYLQDPQPPLGSRED